MHEAKFDTLRAGASLQLCRHCIVLISLVLSLGIFLDDIGICLVLYENMAFACKHHLKFGCHTFPCRDFGICTAIHRCVCHCAGYVVSQHLHLSIGTFLDLTCVLLFPREIVAFTCRHYSNWKQTLKCITPTTLTKTLKTHVLDLWCSDGCRLVSRGRICGDDHNNSGSPFFFEQGILTSGQCDVAGRDHTKGCRIGEAKILGLISL